MDARPELTFFDSIADLGERHWSALLRDDNPFVSFAFLDCMERYGVAAPGHGWRAHHAALKADGRMLAATPLYLKENSHGEFVFDWSWAAAWERAGGSYYPKLLSASPYSPITGPRLLYADRPAHARALVDALVAHAGELRLSSLHFNFVDPRDAQILEDAGLLQRNDWQFHWHNRDYANFDQFLAALTHKRRKEIRRERRAVERAGIEFRWVDGGSANAVDLDDAHAFYSHTFEAKGNLPVISREAMAALARELGDTLLFLFAERDGTRVAGAIFLCRGGRLYGRYWGCHEAVRFLHFETCLYRGIDYCIANGLDVFEPGAQGEHKFMRGFEPVLTRSYHWIGPAPLRRGIADYLERERAAVRRYGEELAAHAPYRASDQPC